ncbi:MAG: nucleotidyltransferase [Lachnospiraceae bacterium]|jgi:nucleotidyltransferase substrate binding protein (TIGR01987 family)|nr:nucleotidyltransferase [Lachnospiraceae bacterium]
MKKYENFCAALKNLHAVFDYSESYDNVVLTGLTALYEICFEQSWKAMKEILQWNGVPEAKTGSPKQVLKAAYQAGMLSDEALWLEALSTRNNVAHAYNQTIALDIVAGTKQTYYQMFTELKTELETNWIS